ncbi:MAG: PQQ-dependent sugar dehydrogenase, partial [Gammaproteobacteria bacterium]|nr:PQQ-dependent sugar dehydrogenase [Gammaproteobacteria bacterium]
MLRIDVDSASPYGIPADNPFAGGGGRAELYAWGLRNPWRWSFDQLTGELWLADVGQVSWEEVDIIVNGGNYGWRCYEGTHPYNTSGCAPASSYIMPVAEYGRTEGRSITGGYVYRGAAIPALTGAYVFTDFSSGTIWGLFPGGSGDYRRETLIPTTGGGFASMAQGHDGEVYFLNLYSQQIFRLASDTPTGTRGPPTLLSATGCVNPVNPSEPAAGLIPYAVNLSFWSDGADKERYLAVPDGVTIDVASDGDFEMPHGSVLLKHFRLYGSLIETRFVLRRADGSWAGYTYEWNASRTDAQLVDLDGKDVVIDGQTWHYPSSAECLACHTLAAGGSLGPEALQLNRTYTYPSTGRTANQLDTFDAIGLLSAPLDPDLKSTALVTPDAQAALELRARSYLHANCANCHRPGGTSQASMDLRYDTPFTGMGICNAVPQNGDLGITDAR